MDGWMCVSVGFVFRLFRAPVCFLSRSQFFLTFLAWICVCEGISLCPPVFMHDSSSFSKVPYGGRSKRPGWQIKLTTSSHTRPTFFFSSGGDWREITLGEWTYNSPHSPADRSEEESCCLEYFSCIAYTIQTFERKEKEENRLGILPICVFSIWKIISLPHCHMATAVQRDDRYKYMNT